MDRKEIPFQPTTPPAWKGDDLGRTASVSLATVVVPPVTALGLHDA
jgi:hypothetical protein